MEFRSLQDQLRWMRGERWYRRFRLTPSSRLLSRQISWMRLLWGTAPSRDEIDK